MEVVAEQAELNRHTGGTKEWELCEGSEGYGGSKCMRDGFRIQSVDASSSMCNHLDHYWSYCLFLTSLLLSRPSFCQLNFPAM